MRLTIHWQALCLDGTWMDIYDTMSDPYQIGLCLISIGECLKAGTARNLEITKCEAL